MNAILLLLLTTATNAPADEHPRVEILSADAQVKIVQEVRLPARETGVLDKLRVREGDIVASGDLLGELNTELLTQQFELAKLDQTLAEQRRDNDVDLRFNRKSQEVAVAELTRATEAIQRVKNSVSATEFDQLRLQAEKAELSVEQAINDQSLAAVAAKIEAQKTKVSQIRLDRCHLRSPIQGMVVEMFAREGEWLNPGDPVMRIVRLDRIYVETFVSSHKHGPNLVNNPARFETQLPDGSKKQFKGHIFFVSPEIHPVTGKIVVIAEIENEDLRLRSGARGTLSVHNK